MNYQRRLRRLRAAVEAAGPARRSRAALHRAGKVGGQAGASGALITGAANIRYLSGFSGSQGALLVDREHALLVSDFRYRYQAAEQAPDFEFVEVARWGQGLASAVCGLGWQAAGFEPDHLTCRLHAQLTAELGNIALVALDGLVEKLRAIKEAEELALMERAAAISDQALERVAALVRPGVTERELALAAEDCIRREAGAELAFPPIVASGPRSAQCHGEPGPRALAAGDLVVIDLGARWQGYGADVTRTVAVREARTQQRQMYSICYQAQQAALQAVRPGIGCAALDGIARAVIEQAGYGEHFGHGLGHGVGLEAHEAPRLSRAGEGELAAGMTATIEPGIYLMEMGGVRLEDLVVVTETGHRTLTRAPTCGELPIAG